MAHNWQRTHDMPDFTRSGQDTAGGGRLVWLVIVVALLGGLVLASAISYGPAPVEQTGGADGAPVTLSDDGPAGAAASGD
ncbi:hypothetical protein [Roseovarius salis]|uniref:hypothetical protein n=1 Tax=Roseovarius salis TaxID=3376063 RepID=UPI0037C668CD